MQVNIIEKDKVKVNNEIWHIDSFIQFLQDENKRIYERSTHFAYNGE
jgi:hypothetical protein